MLTIAVCVKQVPEVAELTLDPQTRRLRREGVPLAINPFDRRALLEAVQLKETAGAGVVAISMGPPSAESALRECLGLGVDRAIHLCDPRFGGADTLATARALAQTVRRVGAEMVMAGRASIDAETGQVAPQVAEMLGRAFLPGVRRMSLLAEGAGLRVECEGDDGAVTVEAGFPVVVTCTDRWKTRAPIVMPDDERAASHPVERWSVDDLGGDPSGYGQAGSPTWVEDVRPVEIARERRVIDAREDLASGVAAARDFVRRVLAGNATSVRGRIPDHRRVEDPRGAIWVVVERSPSGAIRPSALELMGAADDLASRLSVGVAAVVVDPLPEALAPGRRSSSAEEIAAELGRAGADALLAPRAGLGVLPWDFAPTMEPVVREFAPRAVLAPASALGREVMPRLAARLCVGLTGDALGVELAADGALLQLKPAFGGQVVAPIRSRTRPEMTTIRPGMLDPLRPDAMRAPAALVVIESIAADPALAGLRISWEPEVDEDTAALEVAQAVVCVGFGLGKDGVEDARALARVIGGAIGGTRRACDSGWLPRQAQIGISGRSVAPALYLALGVRGSFNHVVGVGRAGAIIAVNRDPAAEVFASCDLGIVADARDFGRVLAGALAGG